MRKQTAHDRKTLEELLRDGIEGDEEIVEKVIADLIGETSRYENADVEKLIHDGQSRVIKAMNIEDWR